MRWEILPCFSNDAKVSSIALGRWTPETAETATYPRLSSENNLNNYQASSFWQKNGNFLKLRSLEIGYTLPFQLSRKLIWKKSGYLQMERIYFLLIIWMDLQTRRQ